ncbi:DUF6918 family protein [Corynebacterium casei]|uniref:Secreted protein n=1 Tax=Corynebacterium casei LMG S-19264 TaxID=1285583 RepID=A0ABN4CB64_9CORY|nr:hypothetical protein [Corynebacterium casei]AHI18598.1 hypothetical protein CCASEI_00055 [Corynebacterium casei LMG S-19264]
MPNLSQLLEPQVRPALIKDLSEFIQQTVNEQSGISGMAIKGAVSTVTRVNSEIIPKGINQILPDMLGDLAPRWEEFEKSGAQDFGAFLEKDSDKVADAVMSTADRHAERINVTPLAKAYKSLRNKGAKIVEGKVPELGGILQNHMK